ncbi:MAG: hypothetical protein PUC67_06140 [Coriobacteriaceae bacterium]|nr:hypothetical protein [Coriobacteriaceae bacterium]
MRPNIYFSQSIDERSWHVWRPVIKVGEHRGHFFFYVDSDDANARELITPPRGLYGKEFLELDHRNVFQLLEFQRRWGPITGLRAQPNKTFDHGTYPNVAPNESFYGPGEHLVFHPDGITQTVFLYEGMGEIDVIAKERFGTEIQTLGKVVDENWKKRRSGREPGIDVVPCHVASVEEVAEAVCDAQVAIRAITGTLREGYTEDEWHGDRRLVRESVRYCNAVLAGSVDPVDIIEDGDRDGVCTLMQYLFISLAKGVMLNNAYRFCQNPDCRRLFTPREYNRRVDSKYCCEDCQIKAKYLRTFKNGKKSHEPVRQCDGPAEAPAIDVEWSTSNIAVRTLRRDQVKLPGDEREATSGSKTEQLLLLQSFLGLSAGKPRTEYILDELRSRETIG